MKLSPSILSVKKDYLNDVLSDFSSGGVDYLHLDVMDGIFVPNETYDYKYIKELKKTTSLPFDIHLMVAKPENVIDNYIKLEPEFLTFHLEATTNFFEIINKIKNHNIKVGCSIKPNTNVEAIIPFLNELDLVLIMSVEPGFGGQKFIDGSVEKIKRLTKYRKENKLDFLIEVDGGINQETKEKVKNAGADIIVVGSYLVNSFDILHTIADLKK